MSGKRVFFRLLDAAASISAVFAGMVIVLWACSYWHVYTLMPPSDAGSPNLNSYELENGWFRLYWCAVPRVPAYSGFIRRERAWTLLTTVPHHASGAWYAGFGATARYGPGMTYIRGDNDVLHVGPGMPFRAVAVRCWWPTVVLIALPLWRTKRLISYRIRERRRSSGNCPNCGYDVRATPLQCPECGADLSKK